MLATNPFWGTGSSNRVPRKVGAGDEDFPTDWKTKGWSRLERGQTPTETTVDGYEDGWWSCSVCGACADEDEENETDLMSEGEYVHTPEWHTHPHPFRGASLEILRYDYLLARARYWHFAGKRIR